MLDLFSFALSSFTGIDIKELVIYWPEHIHSHVFTYTVLDTIFAFLNLNIFYCKENTALITWVTGK
jgi:hypothetical protein